MNAPTPSRPPILDDPTFQVLIRSPAEIVTLVGPAGSILYVSPGVEDVLGYEPEELTGRSALEDVHPEDRERVEGAFASLLEAPGSSLQAEFRIMHADGSWRILNATGRNLLEDERVGAILGTSRDVTEARRAAAHLDAAERYLRRVLEHIPVVLYLIDSSGEFLLSEGRGLEALGLSPGEAVGRSVFELYEGNAGVLEPVRRALAGEEVRARMEVGKLVFESRLTPIRGEDGAVTSVIGVSLDRTDEVRARAADRFKARLLDSVGQAVIVTDTEGRVVYWNQAAADLYGWEREEVLGRSILETTVPEMAAEDAREILESLRAGESWSGEFQVRRKDGTTFPALVTDTPLLDEEGDLVGIIGVSADLSERRELETRMREAQRIEAIGRLAGGVAHDFNNLITALRGYTHLLLADLEGRKSVETDRVRPDLEEIDRTAERAADLTAGLLAFSRRQVSRPLAGDLAELVDSMVDVLARLIGDDVRLEVDSDGEPSPVHIDPSQVEQILLNLVVNARDAMPEGGRITIAVDSRGPDAETLSRAGCDPDGGRWVELAVSDTGPGVDPDALPHIFEPFFTTKQPGVGTGLGLSTVYGIAKQNGGGVLVEDAAGGGAVFRVVLPRVEAGEDTSDAPAVRGTGARPEPPDAVGRVLVVDDDPAVRQTVARTLRSAGYDVLEAASGEEALELVGQVQHHPDLLLCDVVMPTLSGNEVARGVRDVAPDVSVLLISGYTDDEVARRGIERGAFPFLRKPFTPSQLLTRVREVLRGPSAGASADPVPPDSRNA